ncbi:MAG: hypothetical protein ACLVJ6_11430 [Merdibacter sp.]
MRWQRHGVHQLISLANRHPRVNILTPGLGVGGHCLAVDPWFLVERFKEEASSSGRRAPSLTISRCG